jgi:hypothetical protein
MNRRYTMDNNKNNTMDNIEDVPYIVFEGEMARAERHIKRLWTTLRITLIVTALLIAACNIAWLIYLNQFDVESTDIQQDGQGVNIVGDENGVDYNVPESSYSPQDTQKQESNEETG